MFPGPGATVYYNEAGEPVGWSYESAEESYYCDRCGFAHVGDCEDEECL